MRLEFCVACNSKTDLHQHHLVPRVLGGPDAQENLITLCKDCHHKMHRLQERGLLNQATLAEVGNWLSLAEGRTPNHGGTNTYSEHQAEAADKFAESCREHVEMFLRECAPNNRPTFAKLARYLTLRGVPNRMGSTTWAAGQVYDLIGRLKIDWMAMKNANRLEVMQTAKDRNDRLRVEGLVRDKAALILVAPHIQAYVDLAKAPPPAVWIAAKLNEIQHVDDLGHAWTATRVRKAYERNGISIKQVPNFDQTHN